MDSMIKVEGHRLTLRTGSAGKVRLLAAITLAALATACGGGGDGDGNGGNPPPEPAGEIHATAVDDQFNTPIEGVTITAGTRTSTTGADGTATVAQVPTGSVSVTAHAEGLIDPPAQTVTVNEDTPAEVTFRFQRVTEGTGGIAAAGAEGPPSLNGSSFTFRLRVIVIDQDFNPVPGLTASAFTLADCEPVTTGPLRPECVRGIDNPGFDAAYTVPDATPTGFQAIPAPQAVPYAAGLLFDSSESIADSDPTDARIFAAKEYLSNLPSGNLVMLAAFSDDDSLLPDPPLTFFPCEPCTPQFTGDGDSLFASLDELATLEGGGTPLYDSLAASDGQTGMIISVDQTTTSPPDLRRAVVLFSDGKDIYCDVPPGSFEFCIQRREEVVAEGTNLDVDIFTIGLSENVDSLAMAELALRNGGAYMFAERPTQLISIFGVLDRLLADAVPSYEMVWTVNAAETTFAAGRAVIGRLTVDTGAEEPFTLPFAVQIE